MHFWPNLSITRSSKLFNIKNIMANRPKGLTDEEWNAIVANAKMDKLVMLNKVPKESRKSTGSRRPSSDE